MRVEHVFPDIISTCTCLQKIRDFQEETTTTIHVPYKKQPSFGCREELKLVRNIEENVLPHHIQLIYSMMPLHVLANAKKTFFRMKYHDIGKKIRFLTNAVQQIQEHDPFYLTVDDVNESDMLLTDLMWRQMYYEEMLRV